MIVYLKRALLVVTIIFCPTSDQSHFVRDTEGVSLNRIEQSVFLPSQEVPGSFDAACIERRQLLERSLGKVDIARDASRAKIHDGGVNGPSLV